MNANNKRRYITLLDQRAGQMMVGVARDQSVKIKILMNDIAHQGSKQHDLTVD